MLDSVEIRNAIDAVATEHAFSGVARVDTGDEVITSAAGLANRAAAIPNTVDTRFGIASGTKGFTALTVISLVADGTLTLQTTARSLLGPDLPLIGDDVTIEHLLGHRSGIGDYLDEDAGHDVNDYVMAVPVHRLSCSEEYVAVLDGMPMRTQPGTEFRYNNSGFVVLALLAERAAGVPFHQLVDERVCRPAGLRATGFLRSDELPAGVAIGYLDDDGLRSNVLHLPVLGSGDGGIVTTLADVHGLWAAVAAGLVVPPEWWATMTTPRSNVPAQHLRYGLGFWLHETTDAIILEGCDAGVSFRSVHHPSRRLTYTVIGNTYDGAWPILRRLAELTMS